MGLTIFVEFGPETAIFWKLKTVKKNYHNIEETQGKLTDNICKMGIFGEVYILFLPEILYVRCSQTSCGEIPEAGLVDGSKVGVRFCISDMWHCDVTERLSSGDSILE